MRKLFVYLVMGLLCACEVIDEAERLIPVDTVPQGNRTHVLIEYTGFRCVNCPTAAEQANELKKLYSEHLVIVSLHPHLIHSPKVNMTILALLQTVFTAGWEEWKRLHSLQEMWI